MLAVPELAIDEKSESAYSDNPAINWDKENVIAVRVFDTGGIGGVYGDKFDIKMVDLMDNVTINTDGSFYYEEKTMSKSIRLTVSSGSYNYLGKLYFKVADPETDTIN